MKCSSRFLLLTLGALSVGACSKQMTSSNGVLPSGAGGLNNLDSGIQNQKPIIHIEIKDPSTGTLLQTLDTDPKKDIAMLPVKRSSNVVFDLSKTSSDSTDTSKLTVQIDYGDGTSGNSISNNKVFAAAGTYKIVITVTDSVGLKQVKTFNLPVQCTDAESKPLVIDASKIGLTPGATYQTFNFDASAVVVSGGPATGSASYEYAWDFNGDGLMDLYQPGLVSSKWTMPVLWQSSSVAANVYTVDANMRNVGIQVHEKNCNLYKSAAAPLNFSMVRVPAGSSIPVNVIKPDYFLQGDVRGVSGSAVNSPAFNTDFIARQGKETPMNEKKHVTCGYNYSKIGGTAGLNIAGLNWYDKPGNGLSDHAMDIEITNIPDTGSTGLQRYSSADQGTGPHPAITYADYFDPDSGDGGSRVKYSTRSGCTIELTIERATAITPCENDATIAKADTMTINGKYNCPSLKSADGSTIKINDGYFYCEHSLTNQCVGGGGGGGGGQPPTPM